jgi:hypothetical protein
VFEKRELIEISEPKTDEVTVEWRIYIYIYIHTHTHTTYIYIYISKNCCYLIFGNFVIC